MKNSNFIEIAAYIVLIISFIFVIGVAIVNLTKEISKETIKIISSIDNKDLEEIVIEYANKNNINVNIDYIAPLELIEKLNSNEEYDALWLSNSMWLNMLDNISISNSKVISKNPIVFGIKNSKAEELRMIGKEFSLGDLLKEITEGNLKFAIPSVTQTDSGICAYISFLNTLANNLEILSEENLENENIKNQMIALFSGSNRSSGSEEFLKEMYLTNKCDAMITYESSIIDINRDINNVKDSIYAIYVEDTTCTNESIFAYLGENNTAKEEAFLKLQSYLLSNQGQENIINKGRRGFDGNVKKEIADSIFNSIWGLNTEKYTSTTKYPSEEIMKKALNTYQSELKKPTHVLFALDYSGSMTGEGIEQLRKVMTYILTSEKASDSYLQFSSKDKISIVMFNSDIEETKTIDDGLKTKEILELINTKEPKGGTNIYDTVTASVRLLNKEDPDKYNVSVVLITDGEGIEGDYSQIQSVIKSIKNNVPVYSIIYGNANSTQLSNISSLTGGKVFDGRDNLLEAFKIVRGYN